MITTRDGLVNSSKKVLSLGSNNTISSYETDTILINTPELELLPANTDNAGLVMKTSTSGLAATVYRTSLVGQGLVCSGTDGFRSEIHSGIIKTEASMASASLESSDMNGGTLRLSLGSSKQVLLSPLTGLTLPNKSTALDAKVTLFANIGLGESSGQDRLCLNAGNSSIIQTVLTNTNIKTVNGQSIYGKGDIVVKMVHHQITISTLMVSFTGNYIITFDIYDNVKSTKYTSLVDFLSIHPGYSAICIGGHLKDNEDTLIDKPCNLVVFPSSTTSGDTSIKMYKDYIEAGTVYTITKGSNDYNYMLFEDKII